MFTRKSAPAAPAVETEVDDKIADKARASASEAAQPPSFPKMPSISQGSPSGNAPRNSPGNNQESPQYAAGTRIPQKPAAPQMPPHIPGSMPPQASAPNVGRPPEPPRPNTNPTGANPIARPTPTQIEDDPSNPSLRRMPESVPMPNSDLYSPHQSAAGAYRAPSQLSPSSPGSELGSDSGRLIVGKDIELKGEVKNCQLLVVEGTVEAVLVNTRSLEVTADGIFRGTAPVETAEISGLVEGDLIVEGHVFVRSTGIVNGNIEFGELEIERGGRVRGSMTQFGEATDAKSGK